MTKKMYLADPATTGIAHITAVEHNGEPVVRLDRTWFHAQGGGQKADRGWIQDVEVRHVEHDGNDARHIIASTDPFQVGQEVRLVVDEEWRRLNARYHTAGHLIAALTEERFPSVSAIQGHHWPGEARVAFSSVNGDEFPEKEVLIDALTPALDDAIQADLAVRVCGDPFSNRSVQIGEYLPLPCGGTHVPSLRGLEHVEITGVKAKKGQLRVSYRLDS